MKTLIVDDDYITRRLMQLILLPYGKCELAGNGRDALIEFVEAWVMGEPYDLICLAVELPGIKGTELIREITRLEDEKGITGSEGVTILIVSTPNNLEIIEELKGGSCLDYLVKPIDKKNLLKKIRNLGLIS